MEIQGQTIQKKISGQGPVPNSQWVDLQNQKGTQQVLHLTSPEQEFPLACIQEIRDERQDVDFTVPPCTVEIIIEVEGKQKNRLYVVLPTEAMLDGFPFSCNAPFIQDPTRTKIKDPSTSPTNRWLLRRIGALAYDALHGWLANPSLNLSHRAQAYEYLLPEPNHSGNTLEIDSKKEIVEGLRAHVAGTNHLLTWDGKLVDQTTCLSIPTELLSVWDPVEILRIFGKHETNILASHVSSSARRHLEQWKWMTPLPSGAIESHLRNFPYPSRPASDDALLTLWAYLELPVRRNSKEARSLAIVPIAGRNTLFPANDVLIASRTDKNVTQTDWKFLGEHVKFVDPSWIEFLNDQPKQIRHAGKIQPDPRGIPSKNVLALLGLGTPMAISDIVDKVSQVLFSKYPNVQATIEQGIQFARILAHAKLQVPKHFCYLGGDGKWHPFTEGLLADAANGYAELLPEKWLVTHSLNTQYFTNIPMTDELVWKEWITSPKSGLQKFPMPKKWDGRTGESDFDPTLWAFWESTAPHMPRLWSRLVNAVCDHADADWAMSASAPWIKKLAGTYCLPDTNSQLGLPKELYLLTQDTSPLQGVERFVHKHYDQPANQKFLMLLGAKTKPDGNTVEKLLNRVRALAQVPAPPRVELEKLYKEINIVAMRLDAVGTVQLRTAFENEALVFTETGGWRVSVDPDLFRYNRDTIPGVLVVLESVAHLPLWERLQIPEQPTLEKTIAWLAGLNPSQKLSPQELERVRAILRRDPEQVWQQHHCWLTLDEHWTPARNIRWKIIAQPKSELHPTFKGQIADCTMLSVTQFEQEPAKSLKDMATALEKRVAQVEGDETKPALPDWLTTLATCLTHITPATENLLSTELERITTLHVTASRLLKTEWHCVIHLMVIPYLDGLPAGSPFEAKALWDQSAIYVVGSGASYHRELVETLAGHFDDSAIREAITDCAARDPQWIVDYLAEHFITDSTRPTPPPPQPKPVQVPPVKRRKVPIEVDPDSVPPSVTKKPQPADSLEWDRAEAFFKERGFHWEPNLALFINHVGAMIRRAEGGIFEWLEENGDHQIQACYWFADQSLSSERGVELPMELWNITDHREHTWFVFPREDAGLTGYTRADLDAELYNKQIEWFQSKFILRKRRVVNP